MLSVITTYCYAILLLVSGVPVESPQLTVIPGKADVKTRAIVERYSTLLEVHSESGIGNLSVNLKPGKRPQKILLRLYLNGLENCRFTYGKTTVVVSVSSGPEHRIHESLAGDGNAPEQQISAESNYWMPIKQEKTYFELAAPADFLNGNEQQFSVRWIDFYR